MLGLGFALTNFGTKGGVVDTPDLSGSSAAALLAAYGGEGFSMIFDSAAPSLKITDSTTPSNDWDSDLGDGYSVQDFFKTRSFTSYTGPVSSGKRLMQADGYIKPCRHNLLVLSERLYVSSKYTATALAVYASSVSDPFGGTSSAALITEDTSTGGHILGQSATVVAGLTYNGSIYVKAGTSDYVILAFGGASFTTASFGVNLATGAATGGDTGSGADKTITSIGNGWYRISMSVVATASGSGTLNIYMSTDGTWANRSFTGTSRTIYSTGWQLNSGSSALDYVSSQAHNLVIQSRTLGTSWTATDITVGNDATTSPDGTTSAESLTEGVAGTALLRSTAFTVPASSTVTASFYFKTSTATWVRLTLADGSDTNGVRQWFNLATGAKGTLTAIGSGTATSSAITACANGWYRCEITGVCSTSTSLTMSVSSASADASNTRVNSVVYYADCAQAELATSAGKVTTTTTTSVYNQHFDIPVEYNSDGTVKALTREEARTNLALYSNNFSSTWSNANSSDLQSVANGPDGIASANSLTEDATAGVTHRIFQGVTIVSATTYCFSIYAREPSSNSRRYFTLSLNTQANGSEWFSAMFDLQGATVTTSGTGTSGTYTSSGMEAIGNGWYRCYVVGSLPTTSAYALVSLADGGTLTSFNRGSDVYNGDGASNLYFWGAQLEAGSTASSPIVTGSAAVTRAADVTSWSTAIMPSISTALSAYIYTTPDALSAGNKQLLDIYDSSKNDRIQMYYASTSTANTFTDGGVSQASLSGTMAAVHKGAIAAQVNSFTLYENGSNAGGGPDTSGTMPDCSNGVHLGTNYLGSAVYSGKVHEIMIVPSVLTTGQLGTITTA